ncbi:MAG: hypothetical protein KatS3mg008_1995 [Acidimicrobiales bacterium]|nr:MAG: hypothetical protein KatS3mg008_1995 [Acidimicrobiales bacterium]
MSDRPPGEAPPGSATTASEGASSPASERVRYSAEFASQVVSGREGSGPGARVRTLFWQYVFPSLVALGCVALPLLVWVGRRELLASRSGRAVQEVTDPSQPGWRSAVEATETMLVVHERGGSLVGVAVLTLSSPERAGVLVVPTNAVPGARVVDGELVGGSGSDSAGEPGSDEDEGQGPLTLAGAFERGGSDELRRAVETLLGFAVGVTGETAGAAAGSRAGVVTLDDEQWERLVGPVAPVTVTLSDRISLRRADGELIRRLVPGTVELEAEEVGPFLAALSDSESELVRVGRQVAFWESWFGLLEKIRGEGRLPGETGEGLGGFLRRMATREVEVTRVPVSAVAVPGAADDLYAVDEGEWRVLGRVLVPIPQGSDVVPRPTLTLLDGAGEREGILRAADLLIGAGADLRILGNAETFDVDRTEVVVADRALERVGEEFVKALGVGVVRVDPSIQEGTDVLVVLGSDYFRSTRPRSSGSVRVVPLETTTTVEGGE